MGRTTVGRPPVEEYEALVWDFDGTLFDLALDWNGLKRRLAALVPPVESMVLRDLLHAAEVAGRRSEALAEVAASEIAALERGEGWIDDSVDLFRTTLERSVIVTNNVSPTIDRFFEIARLSAVPYVARDMVREPKPNPEGIETLAEHWCNRRTLLIGDTDVDARLAAAVGIDFFQVKVEVSR